MVPTVQKTPKWENMIFAFEPQFASMVGFHALLNLIYPILVGLAMVPFLCSFGVLCNLDDLHSRTSTSRLECECGTLLVRQCA